MAGLDCLVFAPFGLEAARLLHAGEKAAARVVLHAADAPALDAALQRAAQSRATRFGLHLATAELALNLASRDLPAASVVILPLSAVASAQQPLRKLREVGVTVLAEAIRWDDDASAAVGLVDGFVLKGHECGGLVHEQTTFVLLQEFRRKTDLPLYPRGGITPETAAAATLAGARGVVLDDQILLLAESGLTDAQTRRRLQGLSGNETLQVEGPGNGLYLHGFDKPGSKQAEAIAARIRAAADPAREMAAVAAEFSWAEGRVAPAGMGLALAAPLARRYRTLGRLIGAIRRSVDTLPVAAAARAALAEGGPLARANGTRFPILQGPMTRVSDVSDFALRVAEGGALPFAALALLSGEATDRLLTSTRAQLGDKPWGVGLLGFADTRILGPQMEVVLRVKPDFALVAGGRINQILELEAQGIHAYAHSPTAGLLTHFLDEGVRRFIIEGRECGGHVGPMTSFVLWGAVIEALRDHPVVVKEGAKVQVVFAGGVHDALSAAMVATLAEPLAARGVQIGVLMGTAYLFTREIVEAGAIVPDYQQVALETGETRCLWEGPGFASRCAITPIVDEFNATRARMEAEGASVPEIRETLESLSLGRLRMATKGLMRTGADKVLASFGPEERRARGMYMIGQVAAQHREVHSIAEFHAEVAAGSVALLRASSKGAAPETLMPPKPADIAIIGMATLLPGSDTLERYWRRILSGQSAIRTVPEDRWSLMGYYDQDRHLRDKIYSQKGGFLDDVAFNPLDYGIPPTTLDAVDPMQFLALELVSDAVKDAARGLAEPFDRARTSVIFGFSGGLGEKGSQYVARSELPRLIGQVPEAVLQKLPEWTEDSFAGILPNVAAGRVANRFNFGGSNMVVDAACASSLAALYSAVMELESGRADTVITGGIDSLQSPFGYLCFSKTQALSPRGICNTFDKKADGIVIGEGLAAVVLKRLADAERDGDRNAVIKGVGASSDGKARGLTAPLPAGQKRALARAYGQAGFDPAAVDLFEAHGTGTVAGDKAELETVIGALSAAGASARQAAIGSVKTLIGHTKAAAGVSGLIKVALGLHHKVLPPHALVDDPNAVFEDDAAPIHLSQSPRPWVSPKGRKRRAGVSAFGFGGTNFHVALEEYEAPGDRVPADPGLDLFTFVFAAADRAGLQARLAALDLTAPDAALLSAARRLAAQPLTGACRLGLSAANGDEARRKLARALEFLASGATNPVDGIHFTEAPRLLNGGKLAFLFSGQGSQYPGMLRQTSMLSPVALDVLDRAETAARRTPTFARQGRGLASYLWPEDAFTVERKKAQMAAITATEVAQPALGAVEAAAVRLLGELGLMPDMVAGHSYGEFAALHAAGAFDVETLITLSEARGRAMVENGDPARPGGMAAVGADAATTAAALAAFPDVVVANLNSPRQTVIAGPAAAVLAASEALTRARLSVTPVPVSQAFHSPLMHAARSQFDLALAEAPWAATRIPVYSNTHARPHDPSPEAQRRVMSEHLVSSVNFVGMIQAMARDGATVFLEVGPKSVLSGRVPEILGKEAARSIAIDRSSGDAAAFADALVQLAVEGAQVDLAGLLANLAEPAPRDARAGEKNIWYLNGAYARRADAPLRDVSVPAAGLLTPPAQEPAPAFAAPAEPASAETAATETAPQTAAPGEAGLQFIEISELDPIPPATDGGEETFMSSDILNSYHAMMRDFLRVQESVMLAYLGDGSTPRASLAPMAPAPAATIPAAPRAQIAAPVAPVAAAPVAAAPVAAAPVAAAPVAAPRVAAAAPAPSPAQPPAPSPASAAAPAPRPAAAPVPKSLDLMATMISIVADKTGYPEDALDPDQGMESDLGIDSIKRMEILGALQKVLPEAAAEAMRADMAKIAELSTIRAVVDFMGSKMGGTAPAVAEAARPFELTGEGTKNGSAILPRYIQVPFAEPADHLTETLPAGTTVLVVPAGDALDQAVLAELTARGASPLLMPADVWAGDEAALDAWVDTLPPGPLGLIHLPARAGLPDPLTLDPASFRAIQARGTKRFFHLLQRLSSRLKSGGRMVVAMETGGLFGRTTAPLAHGVSAQAGIMGIVKALALEWTECSSKVIDLDAAQPVGSRARALVQELSFLRGRREAGYPGGIRTILRTEPASLAPPKQARPMIGSDWVVLATGGARGITAECLRTLAPFKPTLVLVGRSPLPAPEPATTRGLDVPGLKKHLFDTARARGERIRPAEVEAQVEKILAARDMAQNLADFAAMGARVDYRAADVTDAAAITRLMADLYHQYGRIDLFVHGAGLIEDTFLENKTAASFDRVFDTKVDSALLIARALRPDTLKAVMFFTSVAGRYGNRGQTDYAAANETLNRLAWELHRRWQGRVTVKAINWGPWGATTTGAGMVTDVVRRQFEARGIGMVEAGPGRDLFFKELFWAPQDQVESVGWVADGETMESAVCAIAPPPAERPVGRDLLLLKGAREVAAAPGKRAVLWRFDLVSAPYADHHRFDGVAVMPIAGVMQILSEVPRAFGIDQPVIALEDLQMFKGLTLDAGPMDLHLELEPDAEPLCHRVSLRLASDMKRLRYRARLRLGDRLPQGTRPAPPVDRAARWPGLSIEGAYRQWLSHGPRFQTLEAIHAITPEGIWTSAHATAPADFVPNGAGHAWTFDPGLIDGMLQSVWIWSRAIQDASTLPLGVKAVRRFDGDPALGPLLAQTSVLSAPQDPEIVTELSVFDAAGRLIYLLEDFRGQSSSALNRLGGGWQGGDGPRHDMLEAAQ